jgi:hypothetical protein
MSCTLGPNHHLILLTCGQASQVWTRRGLRADSLRTEKELRQIDVTPAKSATTCTGSTRPASSVLAGREVIGNADILVTAGIVGNAGILVNSGIVQLGLKRMDRKILLHRRDLQTQDGAQGQLEQLRRCAAQWPLPGLRERRRRKPEQIGSHERGQECTSRLEPDPFQCDAEHLAPKLGSALTAFGEAVEERVKTVEEQTAKT